DRQVRWFGALQYPIYEIGGKAIACLQIDTVADQAAVFDVLADPKDGWQPRSQRKGCNLPTPRYEPWFRQHEHDLRIAVCQPLEREAKLIAGKNLAWHQL